MLLLEEIYKSDKAQNSAHFNLRIHRGLSWFKKALELEQDLEFKFISLWISFQAIVADDQDLMQAPEKLQRFLDTLYQKDLEQKINRVLWEKYHPPIRALLESQYVDQGFWDYRNQKISLESCRNSLHMQQDKIQLALQERDSVEILKMLFQRLYSLHHQLMHGGTTYRSSLHRQSLEESCRVLGALLPIFICILLENAVALDLGKPFYPVAHVS